MRCFKAPWAWVVVPDGGAMEAGDNPSPAFVRRHLWRSTHRSGTQHRHLMHEAHLCHRERFLRTAGLQKPGVLLTVEETNLRTKEHADLLTPSLHQCEDYGPGSMSNNDFNIRHPGFSFSVNIIEIAIFHN